MKKILNLLLILIIIFGCTAEAQDITTQKRKSSGYNMLLIGHSFFKPYANHLEIMAMKTGLKNHNSKLVYRGGKNGLPINFWNDSTCEEHKLIKFTLDQGNVDVFGMASGHIKENPTAGYSEWIKYALNKNPKIKIFISISPIDYPNGNSNGSRPNWNKFALNYGFNSVQELYDYYVKMIHKEIVDKLREEFPGTKIFTIPTGWATKNLAQMNFDNKLLDNIEMFGPKSKSIFRDERGHQGQIVIETGTMIWLNSIYNTNLVTLNHDTGYNTDLKKIAQEIIDRHDIKYKQ